MKTPRSKNRTIWVQQMLHGHIVSALKPESLTEKEVE
jgi:hypothetical protein